MDKLFAIDARARNEKMTTLPVLLAPAEAPPLLDKIHAQILSAPSKERVAEKAVGEACAYTVKLWETDDDSSNIPSWNLATTWRKNSMRGVALGQKETGIHIGSHRPGRV